MAVQDFRVHYSGDALSDGRMPVQELAPALLAMSNAFQEIHNINDPNGQPISVDVRATERGSFIIDLILANGPDLFSKAVDFLNSPNTTAAINLSSIVTIFGGVLSLISRLNNRQIKSLDEKDGNVTLKLDDSTTLTIPSAQLKAYRSVEVRKSVEETIKPLKKSGVDSVEFSSSKSTAVTISSGAAEIYDAPQPTSKELKTSESEVYLQLINVAFENGKWKFSEGNKSFFAEIADKDFLNNVEKNNMQFGSTDTLKVVLETRQSLNAAGELKSDYVIKKVIDHHKGGRQLELNFEDKS